MSYDGGDLHPLLTEAEKFYNQAKFNGEANFCLSRGVLKGGQMLRQFILFRGAKDYEEVLFGMCG